MTKHQQALVLTLASALADIAPLMKRCKAPPHEHYAVTFKGVQHILSTARPAV